MLALVLSVGNAQTTDGVISGRVVNAQTGDAIEGVLVEATQSATNLIRSGTTDAFGAFVLPLLPPGVYRVRIEAGSRFQPQELQVLEVPVAAHLLLAARLRPIEDVWEQKQHQSVYLPNHSALVLMGPDVDTSHTGSFEANGGRKSAGESTLSDVIDPILLRDLPLAGRDVYAALLVEPGMVANTSSARGIGLSAVGQRLSSSNFLLDGLENNNYLTSGPLSAIPPDAVQEYRVSTSNYSAEFGRTSGYLANAISAAGTANWHGVAHFNLRNSALNAADFQSNSLGSAKSSGRAIEPGVRTGGSLIRNRLFASLAFDLLRSRNVDSSGAQVFLLPTRALYRSLSAESVAGQLLSQYHPQVVPDSPDGSLIAPVVLAAPVTLNRETGLARLDYTPTPGGLRIMGRVAVVRASRPDYNWSPYPQFTSGLNQNSTSTAISITTPIHSAWFNEVRVGWNTAFIDAGRASATLPVLNSADGAALPGNPSSFTFSNRNRNWEFVENALWSRGRHTVKVGGGLLGRQLSPLYRFADLGVIFYPDVSSFAADTASGFYAALSRQQFAAEQLAPAAYGNQYRWNQYFLFAQDSFRATDRLTINLGFRYDNFGAPVTTGGAPNPRVVLGSASTIQDRIAGARLDSSPASQIYNADNGDAAVRFGFSFRPLTARDITIRGSYGIFYDRPFDNIWQDLQNNTWMLGSSSGTLTVDPRKGIQSLLANRKPSQSIFLQDPSDIAPQFDFSALTLLQPGLRSPRVQSFFLGVQQQVTPRLGVQLNGVGSLGRALITNDILNRQFGAPDQVGNPSNFYGRTNALLPDLQYRANQGSSDYTALSLVARYRSGNARFQAAYTWSHAIDNQSDPLNGDFTDLRAFNAVDAAPARSFSAFVRQFDSRGDRGNADFDQRQNLVFYSLYDSGAPTGRSPLHALLRNWQLSALGSLRSGFPYTVTVPSAAPGITTLLQCRSANVVTTPGCNGQLLGNRANLIASVDRAVIDQPAVGGRTLLSSGAFSAPTANLVGNTGRGAFTGPGSVSLDLSVGRSFRFAPFGESGRLLVRADAYNVLNHANLGNPDSVLSSPTFGLTRYGAAQQNSGLPPILPLREAPRQIELLMRIEF